MANIVMNCDLVAIGAGASGLVAAVKAKHLGVKNIIVLEAAKKAGGASMYGSYYGSGYTKWHKEAGYPDTRDDTFRQRIKSLNWNVNYKLIRKFVDYEGSIFDWFHELCDVSDFYTKPTPYAELKAAQQDGSYLLFDIPGDPGGISYTKLHMNEKTRDPSIGPGKGGSYVVTRMLEQCKKMGIQVITEARAREFIKDSKGNITGLSADTTDGKLQVNFKACVTAAGGFGANMDKLKKQWPEFFDNNNPIHNFNIPTAQGDCIDMAEKAGALVDYKKMNIEFTGPVHHPYSFTIWKIVQHPTCVYVNLNGERYVSETDLVFKGHYPTLMQPRGEAYAIIDDDMVDSLVEWAVKTTFHESWPFDNDGLRKDIEYEVSLDEAGVPGNHTKRANTFEELAKKMKIDPKTFVATMNRYNEYCDKGRDLDLYKIPKYLRPIRKPPFYAVWLQNFAQCTRNGIVINENMELLNASNKKGIPNLFAAGDNAQGMGGGMTWAAVSGYMAGIASAKYLGFGQGL